MIEKIHDFLGTDLTTPGMPASLTNLLSKPYQWTFGGKTVDVRDLTGLISVKSSWQSLFENPSITDLLKAVVGIVLLAPAIFLTLCVKGVVCSLEDRSVEKRPDEVPTRSTTEEVPQPNPVNRSTPVDNDPILPPIETGVNQGVAPIDPIINSREIAPFVPHITLRETTMTGETTTTDILLQQEGYGLHLLNIIRKIPRDSILEVHFPTELKMPPEIAKIIVSHIQIKHKERQRVGFNSLAEVHEEMDRIKNEISLRNGTLPMSDADANLLFACEILKAQLAVTVMNYQLQTAVANITAGPGVPTEKIPSTNEVISGANEDNQWVARLEEFLKFPEELEKQQAELEAELEAEREKWQIQQPTWLEERQKREDLLEAELEKRREERREMAIETTLKIKNRADESLSQILPRDMLEQMMLMPLGAGTSEIDLPVEVYNRLGEDFPLTSEEEARWTSLRRDQIYADPLFLKLRERTLAIPTLRAYFPTSMQTTPSIPQITLQERTKAGEVVTTKIALQDGYIHHLLQILGSMTQGSALAVHVPKVLGITQKMAEEIELLIQQKYLQLTGSKT